MAFRDVPKILGSPIVVFEYIVLVSVVSGVTLSLIYCGIAGISPIPSSRISKNFMFSLVPTGSGTLCELGAGWGSLAFPMAKRFKGARVLAIELSPLPWLFMKVRHIVFWRKNLEIVRGNFLTHPLPDDVRAVVFYVHSKMLEKARPVLEQSLKPGTLIISNVFDIPGWEPEAVHRLEDSFCPQVYVYRVPESDPDTKIIALSPQKPTNQVLVGSLAS